MPAQLSTQNQNLTTSAYLCHCHPSLSHHFFYLDFCHLIGLAEGSSLLQSTLCPEWSSFSAQTTAQVFYLTEGKANPYPGPIRPYVVWHTCSTVRSSPSPCLDALHSFSLSLSLPGYLLMGKHLALSHPNLCKAHSSASPGSSSVGVGVAYPHIYTFLFKLHTLCKACPEILFKNHTSYKLPIFLCFISLGVLPT